MYYLNKVVGAMTNPVLLAAFGVVVSAILAALRQRRAARTLLVLCVVWVWVWATPAMSRALGFVLEGMYLVDGQAPCVEDFPVADAIELHGGSMGIATNIAARGEMWTSADRVWMAARLWKAGKAPKIYVTGVGCPASTVGLLEDFGVPTNALVIAEGPRNTEEEARFVAKALARAVGKPKVLVVTSAWHMRRTMLMYEKYAPEIEAIPAPCDFENTVNMPKEVSLMDFLPSEGSLLGNCVAVHEWVGILGYQLFR